MSLHLSDLVGAGLGRLPLVPSPGGTLGLAGAQQCQAGAQRKPAECSLSQDSYPRFLKSAAYRDLLAEAVVPPEAKRR